MYTQCQVYQLGSGKYTIQNQGVFFLAATPTTIVTVSQEYTIMHQLQNPSHSRSVGSHLAFTCYHHLILIANIIYFLHVHSHELSKQFISSIYKMNLALYIQSAPYPTRNSWSFEVLNTRAKSTFYYFALNVEVFMIKMMFTGS